MASKYTHSVENAKEDEPNIPFYPTFQLQQLLDGDQKLWWFEKEFSQSFYGIHANKNSNACTLIVLLMASKFADIKNPVKIQFGF